MSTWQPMIDDFLTTTPRASDWDPDTRAWYGQRLKAFCTYLAEQEVRQPQEITVSHLISFFADLKKKRKWPTRNGTYTAVANFFRWLKLAGHISFNIFAEAEIKRPRRPRKITRTIRMDYIERMIAAAEASTSLIAIRDVAIMRLLISTGMRREEVVKLDFADLDLEIREISVEGKQEHERTVFPIEAAATAIQKWLDHRPPCRSSAVFISLRAGRTAKHKRLRPNGVNRLMNRWKKAAGIPDHVSVSPHRWRHTFATYYVDDGGDLISLSALLGHTNVETTAIYVNPSKEMLQHKADEHAPKIDGDDETEKEAGNDESKSDDVDNEGEEADEDES